MSKAQLLREQARRCRELAMRGSKTPAPHLMAWAMEFDAKAANAQALEAVGKTPLPDAKTESRRRGHRSSYD